MHQEPPGRVDEARFNLGGQSNRHPIGYSQRLEQHDAGASDPKCLIVVRCQMRPKRLPVANRRRPFRFLRVPVIRCFLASSLAGPQAAVAEGGRSTARKRENDMRSGRINLTNELSRYFREEVLSEAKVQYEAR